MNDADFLAAFENTTLPRPEWTHEAHVRMAYLYLRAGTLKENLPRIRERIRAYNTAQGNPTGYHETITVAFAHLIAACLKEETASVQGWPQFRDTHEDLLDSRILHRHYSKETLASPEARAGFVEPDKTPLP